MILVILTRTSDFLLRYAGESIDISEVSSPSGAVFTSNTTPINSCHPTVTRI
jgi:hypothetical protein